MKKTLVSLITTALLVLQSGTALLAHAEDAPIVDIKTDAFSYRIQDDNDKFDGIVRDDDYLIIENSKANAMVTAVFDGNGYMAVWFRRDDSGNVYMERGWLGFSENWKRTPSPCDLKIGDLFYADVEGAVETYPVWIYGQTSSFEYLGNGVGVLGDAFADVVRHELRLTMNMNRGLLGNELNWDAAPESVMKRGDVMDDGILDIVDVVAVNKYVLGASSLDIKAELSADVNCDLTVDATDSLMLLKEVIGLTTNFEET